MICLSGEYTAEIVTSIAIFNNDISDLQIFFLIFYSLVMSNAASYNKSSFMGFTVRVYCMMQSVP